MATRTTTKGFRARCPVCGEEDSLRVMVNDVRNIYCTSCDNDIDHDTIRRVIREWEHLLAWLETAPEYE